MLPKDKTYGMLPLISGYGVGRALQLSWWGWDSGVGGCWLDDTQDRNGPSKGHRSSKVCGWKEKVPGAERWRESHEDCPLRRRGGLAEGLPLPTAGGQ